MVQNLIDQVKKAEAEAEIIVSEAIKTKENLIKKAQADADEFKRSVEVEAKKRGNELLAEKQKECEKFDVLKEQEASGQVEKINEMALAKESQVMDKIIEYIFN